MSDDVLGALDDLLSHERRALLAGEIGRLAGFAQRKERLVKRIARDADQALLVRLEAALRRNGDLLTASAEGLRSGIDRLRALAAPAPLGTYDMSGKRTELSATRSEVSRRS